MLWIGKSCRIQSNPNLRNRPFGGRSKRMTASLPRSHEASSGGVPSRSAAVPSTEAYHLHRTRFELIAERKVRRRQLIDDGNIEISGRDLRERESRARYAPLIGYRRVSS